MKRISQVSVFLIIVLLICMNLYTQEENAEAGEQSGDALVVAFFPFTYSNAVGSDVADSIRIALAKTMTERQSFSPFSITEWLDQEYMVEKAVNIEGIITKAREVQYPAHFLCEGTVFKSGGYYGVIATLYPLDEENYISCYFRYFRNMANLDKVTAEIVEEMENRAKRFRVEELAFNKRVYIEKITPKFLFKPNIKTGETQLAETPAINIDGVDYANTDHFFNTLLAYNFHISRLFEVGYISTNKYMINMPQYPEQVDYSISVELTATDRLTVLQFVVWNEKTFEVLCHYQYPFGRLELGELNKAFRKNALVISTMILKEEELKKVGIVNLKTTNTEAQVFFKDYFLGKGSQQNTLLPFGLNEIRVGTDNYLKFVLPFALSKYAGDEEIQSADLLKMMQ